LSRSKEASLSTGGSPFQEQLPLQAGKQTEVMAILAISSVDWGKYKPSKGVLL
jgi:hypothetical protein